MGVVLERALQQNIFRHLEAAYPNEGGGFLLGAQDNGTVRVTEVIQIENVFAAEEQYHRYAMTPQDWARLEDEADARGLALVGYYHSHPDSPAIPSIYDRDHALPFFVYLITSVQQGQAAEMFAWLLRVDRSQFDAETLTVNG
ncbi:MAG TPA: M67 family metallopeptidase [Phototrophicaceae bacterium]|nr:M67 family metallopeptidase [Phototrophicaceae bacterium]